MKLVKKFLSSDNKEVNSGIGFAIPGAVVGLAAFCFYAFWLQKDIGGNLVLLLSVLMGGGGAVGLVAGRLGMSARTPVKVGTVKED